MIVSSDYTNVSFHLPEGHFVQRTKGIKYDKTKKKQSMNREDLAQRVEELEKQSEQLLDDRDKLKAITETAQVIILELDTQGQIVCFNPYMEAISGYRLEEVKGQDWFTTFLPDCDYDKIRNLFKETLNNIQTKWNINQIVAKDGRKIIIEWSEKILKDKNGTVTGLLAIGQDVTYRKHTEEKLKVNEERWKSLAQNAPSFVTIVNRDHVINFINKTVSGLKKEDVIGHSVYKFIEAKYHDTARKMIETVFTTGQSCTYESFATGHDGRMAYYENRLGPIVVNGEVVGVTIFGVDISTRKQAEDALKESEKKYRSFIENFQGIAFKGYEDFSIDFYTGKVKEITGYTSDDFASGKIKYNQLLHPDDKQRVQDDINSFMSSSKIATQREYRIIDKNGQTHWIQDNLKKISDGVNGKRGVVGTQIDITERKLAEKALKKSEALHKEAQKVAHIGHWELDSPSGTPVWSEEIYSIFGLESGRDAPSFSEHRNIIHHEDWPCLNKAIEKLSQEGIPFDIQFRFLRSDEEIGWMHAMGTAERNDAGNITRMFGTAQDITKQKLVEEALRESEERLQLVLNGSQLGYWDWNIQTGEVRRNDIWAKMLGYTLEEIEINVEQWTDLHHPDDKDTAWKSIQDHLEGRSPQHRIEYRMRTKDGQYKWILDQAKIVSRDLQGKPLRVCGTHTDITDRKIFEARQQQMQKLEAVGILAGGIAHDFNNLLGIISGNISFALSRLEKNEDLYEVLSDAQEGTKRATNLTQKLLTFAKGGAPIRKTLKLEPIIREVSQFVTRRAKTKCNFEFPNEMWMAQVDEGQLSQVISNLIINADQAMPGGGIITLSAENILIESQSNLPLPHGKYIKINIKDQGIGISEKHIPQIFDPYFSTKQKGSGLGLATSFSIIKKHGGHISVESKIDKGTTFHIYLPVADKENQKVEIKEAQKHIGYGKILVMDDEESILKMAGRMLKKLNYEPHFANDGKRAIEMYQAAIESNKPFDLLILDLTIPGGMGGQETIKKLLEIDPDVKAIVSSGYSNDPVMSNYKTHGFCGVIPKPYLLNELAIVLNKVLEESR